MSKEYNVLKHVRLREIKHLIIEKHFYLVNP